MRTGQREAMTIEEVAEATYRFMVGMEGARDPYSVYLLTEDETVLIEPGPEAVVPSILDGMKRLGLKRLSYIIPTHIHMDHGGGAGKLARLFPEARVVVHPRGPGTPSTPPASSRRPSSPTAMTSSTSTGRFCLSPNHRFRWWRMGTRYAPVEGSCASSIHPVMPRTTWPS